MSRNGPLGAAREDLQAKAKEQVLQDLQITFSGLAADVAITRYRRQVQDCGARQAHCFKKTRKRADIADQPTLRSAARTHAHADRGERRKVGTDLGLELLERVTQPRTPGR